MLIDIYTWDGELRIVVPVGTDVKSLLAALPALLEPVANPVLFEKLADLSRPLDVICVGHSLASHHFMGEAFAHVEESLAKQGWFLYSINGHICVAD